jgi:hypothetical protein
VEVCSLSGLLPGQDCPHRVTELFLKGTEPTSTCSMHQSIALDRSTGLRAAAGTPPARIVKRVYTVWPPELQEWAWERGMPEPPAAHPPQAAGSVAASVAASAGPAPPVLEYSQTTAPAPSEGELPLIMTSPDPGAVYRVDPSLSRSAQRIVVSARPRAGVSLAQANLLVDGQPLAQLDAPPYQTLWQLTPGMHLFSVEGVDVHGERLVGNLVRVEVRE